MRVLVLCLCVAAFAAALPSDSTADTSLRRLRVLTWNVNAGHTSSGSAGLEGQLDDVWAARPDVVALQNVTPDMPPSIEAGLEARSGRSWTASFQSDVADGSGAGSMILTWLPVDAALLARFPSGGGSATTGAVGIRVTINSWPVVLSTARLDPDDATNRSAELQEWQQWLSSQPGRRIVAGDFELDPADPAWTSWRPTYQDVWQSLVFAPTQESGWTVDVRSSTGKPARTDYQWFAQVNPTEVFLVKSTSSSHHALVVDYEVR